jgi:hypothetical protein
MGSLWGTKNGDDPEPNGINGNGSEPSDRIEPRHSDEADERTRLLPRQPPPPAEGYLSPDDPAVSYLPLRCD